MKGLTPLLQVTRNQTSFLTRLIRRLEASAHGQYTENSRMTPRMFSQTLQTLRLTLELMLNGQQWHKTSPQRSSDDFYATPRPKGRTIVYTRTLGQPTSTGETVSRWPGASTATVSSPSSESTNRSYAENANKNSPIPTSSEDATAPHDCA